MILEDRLPKILTHTLMTWSFTRSRWRCQSTCVYYTSRLIWVWSLTQKCGHCMRSRRSVNNIESKINRRSTRDVRRFSPGGGSTFHHWLHRGHTAIVSHKRLVNGHWSHPNIYNIFCCSSLLCSLYLSLCRAPHLVCIRVQCLFYSLLTVQWRLIGATRVLDRSN
jgi:hypothetical protein